MTERAPNVEHPIKKVDVSDRRSANRGQNLKNKKVRIGKAPLVRALHSESSTGLALHTRAPAHGRHGDQDGQAVWSPNAKNLRLYND